MSVVVLKGSEVLLKELINIYHIYSKVTDIFRALNSVIIKRGRTKIGKLWVFGKKRTEPICFY